jgi:hypothetical protein
MAPSHASAPARVQAKRWQGYVQAGRLSREITLVRGADAVNLSGRPHRWQRHRELAADPARSGEPQHARNLHAREPGGPTIARPPDHGAGRSGKAEAISLRCTTWEV